MTNGAYCIELVSPVSEDSVVAGLWKKVGNAPYHICYSVANIAEAVAELRQMSYIMQEDIHEAIAIDNKKVAFLYGSKTGLIELVEE